MGVLNAQELIAAGLGSALPAAQASIGAPIVLPPLNGNATNAINDALQTLATNAQGRGGVLRLIGSEYLCDGTIILPTRCTIEGAGKEATLVRKSSAFPDGNTLIDGSGGVSGASGENHNRGIGLTNLNLNAGVTPKAGLLLKLNYTSVGTFIGLRVSGALGRAIELAQAWDHCWYDLQSNCPGGNSGNPEQDAVMAILGTPQDKSNLQRFFGLRFESFRSTGIYVGSGGNPGNGPYSITFVSPKIESGALGVNATLFKSDSATAGISFRDLYMFMGSSGATSARTGIRGLDLDGAGHVVDGVTASTTSDVELISVIRNPRQQGGGVVRDVRTIGSGTFASSCGIIEQDALRADGNTVVYDPRAMRVEAIRPYGSVPVLGSNPTDIAAGRNGAETVAVQVPQLNNTIAPVPLGSNRNVRGSDLNRITRNTTGTAFTMTLVLGTGYAGDIVTLVQEGTGTCTLAIDAGGTLQQPSGAALTTSGQFTQVRAVRVSNNTNTWRIIP